MARATPSKTKRLRRRTVKNPAPAKARGYVILATKKRGGRYYYAGGARLTDKLADAIRFPSVIHATRVKEQILHDFPAKLTASYHWIPWLPA